MKNRNLLKNSISLLLPIALGIGVLFGASNLTIKEASAYTKDGTLPTRIYLGDNTAQEIKDYYSDLNGLSSTQLQGNNLLKNLKPILMNGQKYYKYDGDSLWALYEIIDRDWEKSPASQISSYDSSSNTITKYTYGTSLSNKGTNPYIHALYVDRNVDNQTTAWDDHNQTQWGINQEHIWPKSQGFNAEGAGGARGDPMHLWAGNGRVNGTEHNNNMYGFVDKSKSYTNPYDAKGFKNLKDNYSGKSLTVPSSTDTVFEPQDSDKGDIARAIFYMVARYNNIAGNDTTINQDNPNLALKQTTENLASYTTTSSNKQTGYMGLMTDLLYWNHLDPVDEFEIHRNNLLFNNYTHNRNPFIDYPEWADYIWGKPVYNGRNYVSYSSNPTGSVNLSTDVINGFKGEQPAQDTVTSIEITKKPTKLVYNSGETLDTAGMEVKAHLSNGQVRTLSSGDYTVSPSGSLTTENNTVTVTYEGKTATFSIGVKGGATESEQITSYTFSTKSWGVNQTGIGTWTSSKDGNGYTTGQGVQVTSDATGANATSSESFTKVKKVIVKYCTNASKGVGSISVKIGTNTAETFNVTKPATGTGTTIKQAEFTFGNGQTGNVQITVGCTTNSVYIYGIDIYEYVQGGSANIDVSSISLNKTNLTLEVGASDQLSATISPTNANVKIVSWTSNNTSIATVNDEGEITAISAGNATITCSALDGSGVTATCSVTVNQPVTLTSISLSGEYPTEFYIEDQFSSDGLVVTANYSDNSHVVVTDDVEITGYDMESEGMQTVTVSYGDKTATYQIEVKEKGLADNEIMFIASQLGLVNGDDLTSYTDSVATVTFTKNGGTQPKYYSSTSSFRVYAKNSFTISGTKKIVKVEFEMANGDSNTITANAGTLLGNTWTGNESSIVFTVGGTSGQRNIVSIKVTYDKNSQDILALSSISLSGTYQTEFFKNEVFSSEGLVVTAHYSDESTAVVTPTSISSPTMSTVGTKTITVSYTENNITKETSYNIEVIAIVPTSIELTGTYKTEYTQGDEFSVSGMKIVEHYNNGTTQNHNVSLSNCSGYDMDTVGEQTVTVTYGSNSTTFKINVKSNGKIVEQKSVSLDIKTYATANSWENDKQYSTINANADIVITALKTGGSSNNTGKYYTSGNNWRLYQNEGPQLTISAPANGKIKTVKVTYSLDKTGILTYQSSNVISDQVVTINANTCTFGVGNTGAVTNGQVRITNIEVEYELTKDSEEKTISSIAVSGNYKTEFNVGDDFSFGGTVTATYSDDSTEDVTSDATFTGYDLSTAGNQTVTVTYEEKITTYGITVTSSVIPPSTGKTYEKISSLSSLSVGSKVIIGYESSGNLIALPNSFSSGTVSGSNLTINNNQVTDSTGSFEYEISTLNLTTNVVSFKSGDEYLSGSSSGSSLSLASSETQYVVETAAIGGNFLLKLSGGTRGIIYRTSTYNKFGHYATSNVKSTSTEYFGVDIYQEVEVSDTTYSLVTDVSDLRTGDKIVIAGAHKKTGSVNEYDYYSLATTRNTTSSVDGAIVNFADNKVEPVETTEIITVEKNGNLLSFKLGDGKYLASRGSSATIDFVDSTTNLDAQWSVTKNENNSMMMLANNPEHTSNRLRLNLVSDTNTYKFKCYSSNTSSGSDPYIFKYTPQVEADTWSKSFLTSTYGCSLGNWDNLASSYNLLSKAAKNEICNVLADESTDSCYRAQAMARYEYILGDSRYSSVTPFITDRGVSQARPVSLPIALPDKSTIFIVVFSLVGVSAIGSYCFVKRKKERA